MGWWYPFRKGWTGGEGEGICAALTTHSSFISDLGFILKTQQYPELDPGPAGFLLLDMPSFPFLDCDRSPNLSLTVETHPLASGALVVGATARDSTYCRQQDERC